MFMLLPIIGVKPFVGIQHCILLQFFTLMGLRPDFKHFPVKIDVL